MKVWMIIVWCTLFVTSVAHADDGEAAFAKKCTACHTIGGGDKAGPDLYGVTDRREPDWLRRWIQEPDAMLAEKDPLAMELFEQFHRVPMPNMRVTDDEVAGIVQYLKIESTKPKAPKAASVGTVSSLTLGKTQRTALLVFLLLSLLIVGVYGFVSQSTRNPVPTINKEAAYGLRRILFFSVLAIVGGAFAMTITKVPYPSHLDTPDRVIYVAAKQFGFDYSHDPIVTADDLATVPLIQQLTIQPGSLVEFRVTSIDVSHNFAIYDAKGYIVAQTQAMPGYTNRLRVRFPEAGHFNVFCLEYCGAAHQLMRADFEVADTTAEVTP